MSNPNFDHNRVIWKDENSGPYQPLDYSQEFDNEWRLFLENKTGFKQHTSVETDDIWINDYIFGLTKLENCLNLDSQAKNCDMGGRQSLNLKFSPRYFQGKRCLDIACGAEVWTKTLLTPGAKIRSGDLSQGSDFYEALDFTINWEVVMCTHDPEVAFENVAKTVNPVAVCK